MPQEDLNGNLPPTIGKIEDNKVVYNVEDHWEDIELEVKTNKIYDISFKEYTERTISSKFTSDPRTGSFHITSEDALIIADVKQYADSIKTNNKALFYLSTFGLAKFQRENNDIVKAMRSLEPKIRHTTMKNTVAMQNANNNNCKLSEDKTVKYSVRMGDQLLSTISSMALDLKISSSTLFRVLMYYAINDAEGFIPQTSINYAKDKIKMFELYLLETVVIYKVFDLAQSIFDEIDKDNKEAVKEFIDKVNNNV